MKNLTVLALLMFAFAAAAFGQAAPADKGTLQETLTHLEKQSWEAWKNRDGKFFQGFLADDHVELGAGGPLDKKVVVAFVGSPVCVVKSYTVDNFKVTELGPDTALVNYRAAQDTTCNGKPVPSPVWISSLFVKRGGHWLNALYQQTPAAQ